MNQHVGCLYGDLFRSVRPTTSSRTSTDEITRSAGSLLLGPTGTYTLSNSGWPMSEMFQGTASVLNVFAHLDGLASDVMESVRLSSVGCLLLAIIRHQRWELSSQLPDAECCLSAASSGILLTLVPALAAVRLLSGHMQVAKETWVQRPRSARPLEIGGESTSDMTKIHLASIQHAITDSIQETKLQR